jgi:hypothetical protein
MADFFVDVLRNDAGRSLVKIAQGDGFHSRVRFIKIKSTYYRYLSFIIFQDAQKPVSASDLISSVLFQMAG